LTIKEKTKRDNKVTKTKVKQRKDDNMSYRDNPSSTSSSTAAAECWSAIASLLNTSSRKVLNSVLTSLLKVALVEQHQRCRRRRRRRRQSSSVVSMRINASTSPSNTVTPSLMTFFRDNSGDRPSGTGMNIFGGGDAGSTTVEGGSSSTKGGTPGSGSGQGQRSLNNNNSSSSSNRRRNTDGTDGESTENLLIGLLAELLAATIVSVAAGFLLRWILSKSMSGLP
jgi:hypothetical protein